MERPLLPRASGRQGRRVERRACPARPLDADQRPAHAAGRQGRREPGRTRDFPSLPPQQFQVLFNSLFKVLFIFPSRYLFAIGLPPVFSLRWDLPPDLGCIPKQPDSAKAPRGAAGRAPTGFSPSPTLPSSRLGRCPPQRTPLQTTIRRPQAGDFHDGLFPLRSPLLGESWLVSSPPPTDMLKLSGWSCLNSGRTLSVGRSSGSRSGAVPPGGVVCDESPTKPGRRVVAARPSLCAAADPAAGGPGRPGPLPGPPPLPLGKGGARSERGQPTLRQTCSRPKPRAQYAFKDSMIHGILQFTLSIAFRCVLHRCGSQDIRC